MGMGIDKTFVGAYIKLGKKTSIEIDEAFEQSEFNEEFNGYFCDYINEKIQPLNEESYKEDIVFSDKEAQIEGEITSKKIKETKKFVETKYAAEILFLRTIFGTADVVVGVYYYEIEIG